jgi:periplasmic protein TonB
VAVAYPFYHSLYLPWSTPEEEKRRSRKITLWIFLTCLSFSVLVPFLPVPKIDREKAETLPPRLARLVLERKSVEPPPPPPAPAPELKAAKKEPKPKTVKKEEPKPVKKEKVETARQRASRAGLLAFKDELAALRDDPSLEGLKRNNKLQRGSGEDAPPERSVILADASKSSGGINTAGLSRQTGGAGLTGRSSTQVSSPLASVGTGQARASRNSGDRRRASRSIEEIQLVFDKNKAAIYSIYNRALRQDPTLQGKVVLKITIDPSGKVTACEVVSSELGDSVLERKIVARVMLFDFGEREVETMVVTYPIDFLPS